MTGSVRCSRDICPSYAPFPMRSWRRPPPIWYAPPFDRPSSPAGGSPGISSKGKNKESGAGEEPSIRESLTMWSSHDTPSRIYLKHRSHTHNFVGSPGEADVDAPTPEAANSAAVLPWALSVGAPGPPGTGRKDAGDFCLPGLSVPLRVALDLFAGKAIDGPSSGLVTSSSGAG